MIKLLQPFLQSFQVQLPLSLLVQRFPEVLDTRILRICRLAVHGGSASGVELALFDIGHDNEGCAGSWRGKQSRSKHDAEPIKNEDMCDWIRSRLIGVTGSLKDQVKCVVCSLVVNWDICWMP
jgi:hypothetical protein